MKKLNPPFKWMTRWAAAVAGCVFGLLNTTQTNIVEAYEGLGGPPHIGTFEGSTTFTTSSSNGINPGLYLEVMDSEGNYTEYTSEDGVITIQGTKEGAYVTQAKLLGKTKYVDQQTGEISDQWEDGRDLKLESVQMPVLTTVGKNLYNLTLQDFLEGEVYGNARKVTLKFKPNTQYTCSSNLEWNGGSASIFFNGPNSGNNGVGANNTRTATSNEQGEIFIAIASHSLNESFFENLQIQIEEGSVATTYEPYQSNILTVNEDVTLRGVGNVKDELNLLTGEVTTRIGEMVLDGSDDEGYSKEITSSGIVRFNFSGNSNNITQKSKPHGQALCDKLITSNKDIDNLDYVKVHSNNGGFWIYQADKDLDVNTFKEKLKINPLTIKYQLATESIKTVGLNSTYYFDPVLNRDVRVNGTIVPLVASVTIPTEPLSFIIDPNQDEGQELVAPEFSITNQTPGSIYLNLKAFEQTTNVLNDVLPTTYPDWSQLDKHQSKDIALALVPKPSEGWLSLTEGPRYVADSSNYELGMVKAKSTVDFTFSALHGRTFVEELNPQYRLSFEFGF